MSVAGVDPTAVTGIPGSAERVEQLERVAETRETVSSRKEDVAHTNINMGLNVLWQQFIYVGTYSWLTTDSPGKVIAVFPIHPDATNSFTSRVYSMFNVWVGGAKYRIRIIGTAFYGGGLYFVRIPPEFKLDEIHQMNLSGFSAFPHMDMDPKNIDSIDIDMQDYRSTHFHTGELDLNNPNSFGGYLAIVVNARLVTQSSEIPSLDLRVEAAGNFDFKVPRPIREAPSEATGPLSARSLDVKTLSGCDDMTTAYRSCDLVANPNTAAYAYTGNIFHVEAGGLYKYRAGVNAELNSYVPEPFRQKWMETIRKARQDKIEGTFKGLACWYQYANFVDDKHRLFTPFPDKDQVSWKQINFRKRMETTAGWNDDKLYGVLTNVNWGETLQGDDYIGFTADTETTHSGTLPWDLHLTDPNQFATIYNSYPLLSPINPDPRVGRNSYITLSTNHGNSVSTQAAQWAEDLARFQSWPVGSAARYKAISGTGQVLGYFHLHQDGHMFGPPTDTTVKLTNVHFLEFDQWVDDGEEIPLAQPMMTTYMQAQMNNAVVQFKSSLALERPAA